MIRLASVHVYPVKSCRGLAVEGADLDALGLAFDRRWMVVDAGGRFLTQRELPRMALVTTALEPDALVLGAPGAKSLRVPFQPLPAQRREIEIWRHRGPALDEGDAAASWLASALGVASRLVRIPPGHSRRVNPERFPGEAHTAFTDGYPLLVIGRASLDDLNRRLPSPVAMERFRPNLVVEGCEPYDEDAWQRARIDAIELALVKGCPRCTVTVVDPQTAERTVPEPLRTLASYRKHGDAVLFGRYAVHLGRGRLASGAVLEPLTRDGAPRAT